MKDRIFWLKNRLFRRHAVRLYRQAMQQQRLPEQQLNQLNWEKRKKIVEHAYHHIPFYRQYYDDMNFHPDCLKCEDDWARVPVLEKQMIREHLSQMIDPAVARKHLGSTITGGSTGMPLKLHHDLRFPYEILSWRLFSWWRVSPGCNKAQVWRIPDARKTFRGKIKDFVVWFPTRRLFFDATLFTDDDLKRIINKINRLRPEIILGYTGSIEQIALYAKRNQIAMATPRFVWTTSAPATQALKELIRQVFHAPLMDQYGSCEVMWIASNCPHSDNLHLYADYRHIDILDDHDRLLPRGNVGNIAVTDLENYAFPIIRYKIEDRGSLLHETCPCGISLPLMSPVQGRKNECLRFPDGSVIAAGAGLTDLFDDHIQYVEQFQVVQKKDYSIVINIVFNPHLDANVCLEKVSPVLDTLAQRIKHQAPIQLNPVERIPDDRGKIRHIVSELNQ